MRVLIPFLLVAFALLGSAQAEDADAVFRNGLSAFNEGIYDRARAAWGPLAAAGDARAQTGLGYMYYSGRGVARDSARAAEFFDRAADQGEPTAQLFLALMYFKSDGVPQNMPLAMMWLELAIAGGQADVHHGDQARGHLEDQLCLRYAGDGDLGRDQRRAVQQYHFGQ